MADVYRGLAYYHQHPDEMAGIRTRRERTLDGSAEDPAVATGPDDIGEPWAEETGTSLTH